MLELRACQIVAHGRGRRDLGLGRLKNAPWLALCQFRIVIVWMLAWAFL